MELKTQIAIDLPKAFRLELNGETLEIQAGEMFWKKLGALPAKLNELQKEAEQNKVTEREAAQLVCGLLVDLLGGQIEKRLQDKSVKELALLTVEITRQFSMQMGVRGGYGS